MKGAEATSQPPYFLAEYVILMPRAVPELTNRLSDKDSQGTNWLGPSKSVATKPVNSRCGGEAGSSHSHLPTMTQLQDSRARGSFTWPHLPPDYKKSHWSAPYHLDTKGYTLYST